MSERESLLIKLNLLKERSPDLLRAHYDHQSPVEELELFYQTALMKVRAEKTLSDNKQIVVAICCAMEILHKKRTLSIEEILKSTTYAELERLSLAYFRSMDGSLSVENRSPEELEFIEMFQEMRLASSLSEIIGIVLSKSHPI